MKEKNKVFVYGTLKEKTLGSPYFVVGTLYNIGMFPGLVLEGENKISGQIIHVDDDELNSLDVYEGVARGLYRRELVNVGNIFDNDVQKAWAYIWNGYTEGLREILTW